MIKPRFEYENRVLNHFSVNKMTAENYATINRGSFAEIDKNRQDYTGDSENISPVIPKILDRILSGSNIQ